MTIRGRLLKWLEAGIDKKSYSADWLMSRDGFFKDGADTSKPMESHPTVYAVVQVISQNVAAVPTLVIKGEDPVYDTPLQKLLSKPNPLESEYSLYEKTAMFMSLQGEAFWVLIGSKGMEAGLRGSVPAQVWAVPPDTMKEATDDHGNIIGWVYQPKSKGQRLTFEPEEVLHFKRTNPYNTYRGLSPLSAARLTLQTDAAAIVFQKSFYDHSATPGGIVTVPGEPGVPIDQDLYNQYKAQFENRHKGAKNAYKVAILSEGTTYAPTQISFVDQQYLEGRKWNRDQLCQIWLVPKTVIGATEDLNYATSAIQRRQFYVDCLGPLMKLIEIKINEDLFQPYQPDTYFQYDRESIEELKPAQELTSNLADTYWRMGVPMTELVEAFNLPLDPTWEGADLSYIPIGVKVSGTEDPATTPPPTGTSLERDAARALMHSKLKRFFFEQRLRVIKSVEEGYDPDMWKKENEELAKALTPVLQGMYRETPGLLEAHIRKLSAINDTFKRNVEEYAVGLEGEKDEIIERIKKVYNNAGSKSAKIAELEVLHAFDTISAIKEPS